MTLDMIILKPGGIMAFEEHLELEFASFFTALVRLGVGK
jgi:hypothetical protein